MNDSDNTVEQPQPKSHLTRFPYQKGKPAPKGHKYNQTHGLTPILKHSRYKRRRAIDTRFTEGKEAMAFRDSLIAMKGGIDSLTPTLLAVVDLLTAKYYRLLRVYRYLYKQPPPPVIDEKRRRIAPLWKQVDGMEDSLLNAAKQYGFERIARQIPSIDDIKARYETDTVTPAGNGNAP